jgi:glutathione S-transferase
MFMIRHGIDFELCPLNFVEDKNAAMELAKETPINKVPYLIEDDQKIFDSRVIVNHLIKKHALPALTVTEENLVSAVYSCLDTAVILFLMKRDGFDINGDGFFVKRNRERIPNNLNFLAEWASSLDPKKSGDWNYASMSLFSFLNWAEARAKLIDVKTYPIHAAFMAKFANAPGVKETSF